MAFDAGAIVASLDLDRDPFQRKLAQAKRDAKKFADSKYSPKVDADTRQATAKVIDIRDRLDRLSNARVTPKLTVDNAQGLVKLVDFQEKLDRLRGKVATARADVDSDAAKAKLDALDIQLRKVGAITAKPKVTVEGVERANIQLDALELKLRALGATTARPSVTGGGGGGLFGNGGLFGKGGFFRPKGALLNAGIFLGPAAVPLGAAALGAGASFLTPTVAGVAGLGLFGAASKSAVTRVDAVQKKLDALNTKIAQTPQTTTTTTKAASPAQIQAAQMRLDAAQANLASLSARGRSTTSAQASVVSAQASLAALQGRGGTTTTANKEYEKLVKQRQALLKTLTPAEREAAEGVDRLEKTWVKFQRALEPQTFKALASGTDIATKGLNLMLPATKAVGKEVDTLAADADAALGKPFWKDFFGRFLTQEAPRAVDTLGRCSGMWGPDSHTSPRISRRSDMTSKAPSSAGRESSTSGRKGPGRRSSSRQWSVTARSRRRHSRGWRPVSTVWRAAWNRSAGSNWKPSRRSWISSALWASSTPSSLPRSGSPIWVSLAG